VTCGNALIEQVEDFEYQLQERRRSMSDILHDTANALAQRQGEQINHLMLQSPYAGFTDLPSADRRHWLFRDELQLDDHGARQSRSLLHAWSMVTDCNGVPYGGLVLLSRVHADWSSSIGHDLRQCPEKGPLVFPKISMQRPPGWDQLDQGSDLPHSPGREAVISRLDCIRVPCPHPDNPPEGMR
jgi:hypothetical protein